MLEIALMIEGQNGLNWERWQRLARAAEDLGFVGLYRSDHFTNSSPPDKDSLELWVSLAWLASHTTRLEFGPLVSPVSFRNPTLTARMAAAIDDLSDGRLTLGLGAGWQAREHTNFGFELLSTTERFNRFSEGLEVITRLLNSDSPSEFVGRYYSLKEAILLPRPQRAGGPPIMIGGNGPRRTLPLVARYATEWNALFISAEEYRQRAQSLDILLEKAGRNPTSVKRSMMVGSEFGRTDKEVRQLVENRSQGKLKPAELAARGVLVGTSGEVVAQLQALADAGVQRVMVQWLALDDLDRLEAFAQQILPQFH